MYYFRMAWIISILSIIYGNNICSNVLDATFYNYSAPHLKKKLTLPKKLTGKQLWRRYTRIRKIINNAITPVWRENLRFDTFPSGTQLKDFPKLVMRLYVESNASISRDDDDGDNERTPATPSVTTPVSSSAVINDLEFSSPLECVANMINGDAFEEEAEVPMPLEWLVFVKFGPPANDNCDPIFLVDYDDNSGAKPTYNRKHQRDNAAERDEKERGMAKRRTSTRASTAESPNTALDREDDALADLKVLLKNDQIVGAYERLLALVETPEETAELKKNYRSFLSDMLKNKDAKK